MSKHSILEKFDVSEDEEYFIKISENIKEKENYTRVISNLYLSKTIEDSTNNIINSNKKLARSNNFYAKGMLCLTAGLIIVAILDIIF